MSDDLPLRETPDGVLLSLLVSPGSSRDRILGIHDGALKLAVAAAPDKGKANRSVVKLLSRVLEVRLRDVEIVSGSSSRAKNALVRGLEPSDLRTRLAPHL